MAAVQEQDEPDPAEAEGLATEGLDPQIQEESHAQYETLLEIVEDDNEIEVIENPEEETPLEGSQYSSPGEEYELEAYEQYSEGEGEHMYAICHYPSENEDSESPVLVEATDAEEQDSEDERHGDAEAIIVDVRSMSDRHHHLGSPKRTTEVVRMSHFPKARPKRLILKRDPLKAK
jgi:hypothetical protein